MRAFTIPVTIALGESLSADVSLLSVTCLRLYIPAGFEGSAITFQLSEDGSAFYDLLDTFAVEIGVGGVTTGKVIQLDPDTFRSIRHIKIRAGTLADPVVQAADRTLTLVYEA